MVSGQSAKPKFKHYVAWHALIVHFPISLFGAAFLFQALHFFVARRCFDLATTTVLLFGAIAMVPSLVSGWVTWKGRYRGLTSSAFRRKIYIGFGMLLVSIGAVVWQLLTVGFGAEVSTVGHIAYAALIFLLIVGAALEGYYGGPLTHRRRAQMENSSEKNR